MTDVVTAALVAGAASVAAAAGDRIMPARAVCGEVARAAGATCGAGDPFSRSNGAAAAAAVPAAEVTGSANRSAARATGVAATASVTGAGIAAGAAGSACAAGMLGSAGTRPVGGTPDTAAVSVVVMGGAAVADGAAGGASRIPKNAPTARFPTARCMRSTDCSGDSTAAATAVARPPNSATGRLDVRSRSLAGATDPRRFEATGQASTDDTGVTMAWGLRSPMHERLAPWARQAVVFQALTGACRLSAMSDRPR